MIHNPGKLAAAGEVGREHREARVTLQRGRQQGQTQIKVVVAQDAHVQAGG